MVFSCGGAHKPPWDSEGQCSPGRWIDLEGVEETFSPRNCLSVLTCLGKKKKFILPNSELSQDGAVANRRVVFENLES